MLLSALPVVSIAATDAQAWENGDTATFLVSRDAPADTPLKVKLAISGTARNARDYARIPATATIPAGADSVEVRITPIDDGRAELDETAILTIAASSLYTIDQAGAGDTVTIADATYAAQDFFPLTDGARWDYRGTRGGERFIQSMQSTTQGQGSQLQVSTGSAESWSEGVSYFQPDAAGIVQISQNGDGEITTYTTPRLWLPAMMEIGQSYPIAAVYTGTDDGTLTGTIQVIGVRTIRVSAGTFRCLKVQMATSRQETDWSEQGATTLWLARGLGIVRMDDRTSEIDAQDGRSSTRSTMQLTSWYSSSDWEARHAMSTVRNQFAGGAVDGQIYVFGGNGAAGDNLASAEVFDPQGNQWSGLADNLNNAGDGVEEVAGAVVGGKLYVVGAWGGTGPGGYYGVFNFVQAYDPVLDQWTTLAAKPTPVSSAPCAVYDGEIYVFGGTFAYEDARGREHSTRYSVVEAYNPATDTWRQVTKMPRKLGGSALAVVGDTAYLMGGYTSSRYTLSKGTISYNFLTGKWVTRGLAAMPQARVASPYSSAAPVIDGKIWVIGGILGSPKQAWATNRVDIYDPAANTWSQGPFLPEPVSQHLSVVVGDTLYVIGGSTYPGLEDDVVEEAWALPLLPG
jgi:N-acetylneuraminic acid mutarotase